MPRILNDWHTCKADVDWKHRANHRRPPGLAADVFCILMVRRRQRGKGVGQERMGTFFYFLESILKRFLDVLGIFFLGGWVGGPSLTMLRPTKNITPSDFYPF